jgi:hypothetical protein
LSRDTSPPNSQTEKNKILLTEYCKLERLASMETDEARVAKAEQRIEQVLECYAAGKPLYPRSVLEYLDRQFAEGNQTVYINDFVDDTPNKHVLRLRSSYKCSAYVLLHRLQWTADLRCADWNECCSNIPAIRYNSLQDLTSVHPEYLYGDRNSISIHWYHDSKPNQTLTDVTETFGKLRQDWRKSEVCESLEAEFAKVTTLSVPINKIVCFGLGSLQRWDDEDDSLVAPRYMQHAAIETMAEIVRDKGSGNIQYYAQDPAYTDIDKEFLKSIGITPLDDPKGFLEVDENTLVFSVSPNVPVRQIIADVQWPAAMLWNTVEPERAEKTKWEKVLVDDAWVWKT